MGAGRLYSLQNVDNNAYGSLPALTSQQILKQGILATPTTLSCPAPGTSGQSINYLIEAQFQENDTGSVVLSYYNSANPQQPLLGQNNSGTPQNTIRSGQISLIAKAGVAATTGTQTTPAPDAGYTGLYVVTVAFGQTQINSGNIAIYGGAPFLTETLTQKISAATAGALYAPIPVSGSFTGTFTGVTGTVTVTIEYSIVGPMVFLTLPPAITGTSNATTFTITGIPVALRPASAQNVTAPDNTFVDNTTALTVANGNAVTVNVGTGGILTLLKNGTNWTGAGTKGLASTGSKFTLPGYSLVA